MITIEAFKETDLLEAKVRSVFMPKLEELSSARDAFYAGAFQAYNLGDVIFDLKADPITEAIVKQVYRTMFFAVHEMADTPANFENWIAIFNAVWGETGAVRFVVPGPGKLEINIDAFAMKEFMAITQADEFIVTTGDEDNLIFNSFVPTIDIIGLDFIARAIENNQVVNYNILDHEGDQIQFQSFDSRMTQDQATKFVFQLSAYGIYTTINLNFLN